MKYAILGGGGCFGLNLARYLMSQGHEVIGAGRSTLKPACFSLDTDGYVYRQYHVTHEVDYLMAWLDEQTPEILVNFCAQGEGAASFDPSDWWRFFETNGLGLSRLIGKLAQRDWLARFVHISTSELYGSVSVPVAEDAPLMASSPYSASKAGFDLFLGAVADKMHFNMNIVRPCNCYTPGQQLHRIIPRAVLAAVTKRKLPLHGGGVVRKSYMHATDLSRAIELIVDCAPVGETYNVGPDGPVTIRSVVQRIAKHCDVAFDDLCDLAPERPGQDGCYWLNSDKVKALGWEQKIGWDDGLDEMLSWVLTYADELAALDTTYRMRA